MSQECRRCDAFRAKFDPERYLDIFVWLGIGLGVLILVLLGWATKGLVPSYVGLSLVGIFVWQFVISSSSHAFTDRDKHQHHHAGLPDIVGDEYRDHLDRPIFGPLLQIPTAGWFRRAKLLNQIPCGTGYWETIKGRGNRIHFKDSEGREFITDLRAALEIMSSSMPLLEAYTGTVRIKDVDDRVRELKRERDSYGRGVCAIQRKLLLSKQAQRSSITQHMRELLEQVEENAGVSMNTVKDWLSSSPEVLEGLEIKLAAKKNPSAITPAQRVIRTGHGGSVV